MNPQHDLVERLSAALDQAGTLEALVAAFRLDAAAIENAGGTAGLLAREIMAQVERRDPASGFAALAAHLDQSDPSGQSPATRRVLVIADDLLASPPSDEIALIRRSLAASSFQVETPGQVSILESLRNDPPEILHISGLSVPDESEPPLAARVQRAGPVLPCLLLVVCDSQSAAWQLVERCETLVRVDRALGEAYALAFIESFYQGLAVGLDPESAWKLGCSRLETELVPPQLLPKLSHPLGPVLSDPEATQHEIDTAAESPMRSVPTQDLAYPLWFGTNRRPVDPLDPSRGFSTIDDQQLHLGRCWVDVPASHQPGSLGSSLLRRIWNWTDDRLKLTRTILEADEIYWRGMREALTQLPTGQRAAVVLIHGFNVSFRDAALRAAQLGVDLDVPGIMAFYSWPSHERVRGYVSDAVRIEASERFLAEFLTKLAAQEGVEAVHLIAHSMGNRGLLRSIQRVVEAASSSPTTPRIPFGQIVLAAPDVDQNVFRDLARVYASVARRTTLYASSKDRALRASSIVNDGHRAGFTPPVTVLDGIDTIDATKANLTWMGHGEFAEARGLLADLKSLFLHDLPPGERGLTPSMTSRGERYWVINA